MFRAVGDGIERAHDQPSGVARTVEPGVYSVEVAPSVAQQERSDALS
jgi:hypothetical protein